MNRCSMVSQCVDVSHCPSPHSLINRVGRMLWSLVWLLLFRPSPRLCFAWRRLLLRAFGASLGQGIHIYPSCRIWAPWNLHMGDHSCLADHVICYNVAPIVIGNHCVVSQYSHLCTASHDHEHPHLPLITRGVVLEDQSWVCTDVYIGPGVTVGCGAVVGARSSVYRAVTPWVVVVGNPARFAKERKVRELSPITISQAS